MSNSTEKMLMNPHTGSVDTEENWRSDLRGMDAALWGAETIEEAMKGLIEVERDEDGDWKEVE